METRNDVFYEQLQGYLKADRCGKGKILDSLCLLTHMHRDAVIRRLKTLQLRGKKTVEKRGRPKTYGPDVTAALKDVWIVGNEVCGELLHPVITEYIAILSRDGMWDHGEEATKKLLAMSRATVKRRVGMFLKARRKCRGLSDTKPSHLKHLVPIFTGPWRDKPPGYGQVDTVRHANTAFGDAVYTAQYTDAATLTTIPRAQWNKGDVATRGSLQAIQTRLPFPWLGAHPDTGSEFINHMVVQWCAEQKIELTRSRPNHKNDNMYIEERNGHVVRKVVGYLDLNCIEAVEALNRVYDVLTPYLFHFMAVRRMTGKEDTVRFWVRKILLLMLCTAKIPTFNSI